MMMGQILMRIDLSSKVGAAIANKGSMRWLTRLNFFQATQQAAA